MLRAQPCSDLHSASLSSSDCAAMAGGSSSAEEIMSGISVLMSGPRGALGQQLRIGAEIFLPAFAVLAGREIKAAGGQDGAGQARPLRAMELGMRNVGCDVGRAGRVTHEIDALRVGAVLDPRRSARLAQILIAGRPRVLRREPVRFAAPNAGLASAAWRN